MFYENSGDNYPYVKRGLSKSLVLQDNTTISACICVHLRLSAVNQNEPQMHANERRYCNFV